MRNKVKRFLSIFLVQIIIFTAVCLVSVSPVYADEYTDMLNKWKDTLTGGSSYSISDPVIAANISAITSKAQSYWDSMEDNFDASGCIWSALPDGETNAADISNTYYRLRAMALAYCTRGSSLENNSSMLAAIKNGLDWVYNNWYNESKTYTTNWWYWEIGIPTKLNDIVVLLYNQLSSVQRTNYMNAVEAFQPTVTMTGANRVWECIVIAVRGVIVKSSSKLASARDGLSQVLSYVTNGDGFYVDGSFIQHTNHPYNGSYGIASISDTSSLIYLLDGTTWEVTDPDVQNIYDWVYDSFEPLIYKGAFMDMFRGRDISRRSESDHYAGRNAIKAIIKVAQFAPPGDATAYKRMVKYWISADAACDFYSTCDIYTYLLAKNIMDDSGITSRGELVKYKLYPSADRAVLLRPGFGFGVSMYSSRIANYEYGDQENSKGWYTGEGMTYIYNSDQTQYSDNFWPTVNSYRLPGTTVLQATAAANHDVTSDRNWVGGAEILGTYGTAGMDLHTNGKTLNAKKSWFMFDDEIVALGAGISSTDNKVVETIVENRMLNSSGNNALKVNGTSKSTSLGWSETMTGVNWIHLAGNVSGADIGYYFPGSATVKGLRESRNGAWSDITQNPSYTDDTVYNRKYMTLWLDHGSNPSNANYSYVILPGMTSTQVSAYAGSPDITVLENSSAAQGVKENTLNITGVNFWNDASKTVGIITSNKKASVLTKETANDIEVAVSDPTQANNGNIIVEINRSATGTISRDSQITVNQLSPTIKLTVNVSGSRGKTFKAKFNLGGSSTPTPTPVSTPTPTPGGSTVTLGPTADAFVRAGTYGDSNYGTNTDLDIRDSTAPSNIRKAYLKFDVSGISSVSSAKLKVYGNNVVDSSIVPISAYGVDTDSWTESGITWNNAPAKSGSALSTVNVNNVATYYEFDVTSFVRSQVSGDDVVTLLLICENGSSQRVSFMSKENAGNNPILEITTGSATPTPTPTPNPILLSDNFEDNNADGWTVASGSWSVVTDGTKMYKQSNTSGGVSYAGQSSWTDYTVEASVKPISFNGTSSNGVGLFARYTNTDNRYAFIYNSIDGQIKIIKKVGGTAETLAAKSYSLTAGNTYTFKASVNGSSLVFYINGVNELSATDSSLTSGMVALNCSFVVAEFDNVVVTAQ